MSQAGTVSNATIKRLARDVKEIMKNPLEENGIYYMHSDSDMLRGQALIIGPTDTPYAYGYYYFDIVFPTNYPQSPPVFTYDTNDGMTRFNPNLYKNGKVCISVLNTWRGDQWSPCQTISSILLSVCTVLNDKPLLNEPGIKESDPDFLNYNKIITYKNFSVGIVEMLESKYIKGKYPALFDVSHQLFLKNYEEIKKLLDTHQDSGINVITTRIYGMQTMVDYKKIKESMNKLYNQIKN